MLTHQEQQKIIGGLLKRKQNALCADCNSKMPCWASLDFGVFVCMNCSGAHRALGPSITRVKSTRLDSWNRDWLQNMQIGNSILNVYWEHQLDGEQNANKPTTNTPIENIIKFVHDKYVKKLYANSKDSKDPLQIYKHNKTLPLQSPPQPPQPPKPNSHQHISNSANKSIKNQIKAKLADFSVFDTVLKAEKGKPPQASNLISFEGEKAPNTNKKNSFDDFKFSSPHPNQQEKYNKQQFMSMGGISSIKPKNNVNFQGFGKINGNSKLNSPNDNLINFQLLPEQKNIHNTNNSPYMHLNSKYETNQTNGSNNINMYATMGAFNPSAKQQTNFLAYQQLPPKQQKALPKQLNYFDTKYGLIGESQNIPKEGFKNISLQSNISFNRVQDSQKYGKSQKSWIDQWK